MTPGARAAAAVEVLEQVRAGSEPAEEALRAYGRAHRFAGSKDRRAIADHVYQGLRRRASAEWRFGGGGRALLLAGLAGGLCEAEALCNGEGYAPQPLSEDERRGFLKDAAEPDWVRAGCPPWLEGPLRRRFEADFVVEAAEAILRRAPVDLRVNALRGPPEKGRVLLEQDGLAPEATPFSSLALRLPPDLSRDVHGSRAFRSGWVEVQDEGSQILAFAAGARPGETVVDYCAGAGGKTLALAAEMAGRGRLIACDVDQRRLAAMDERLERAGARAERRLIEADGRGLEDLAGRADCVLVDAPCSGSGTWRRRPEAAWRLTPSSLARLVALQGAVLERASGLLRGGGRLLYATCSLLEAENEGVVDDFLRRRSAFKAVPVVELLSGPSLRPEGRARLAALAGGGHTLLLTPRRTGTDGFFLAALQRTD